MMPVPLFQSTLEQMDSRRKYRRFICLLRMGMEIGCWRQKRMGPIIIQNSLMPCMQQTGKLEGTR